MYKREDPSDTRASILALLMFVLFLLMMYCQWWRTQVRVLGWAAVPPTPWAVSGLLVIFIWGFVSYYAGLLGMQRLHKWMTWLPAAMAVLALTAYIAVFMQGKLPRLSSFFGFLLLLEAPAYYALYVFFYTPLAGLVRLVPFLGVRMANTYDFEPMDPMAATVICLMYLSISIYFHALGKKVRVKMQELAPPDEPPEQAECLDAPQE